MRRKKLVYLFKGQFKVSTAVTLQHWPGSSSPPAVVCHQVSPLEAADKAASTAAACSPAEWLPARTNGHGALLVVTMVIIITITITITILIIVIIIS